MTDTSGKGTCGGALSVVNAIATGFGSAFGIGLSTEATTVLHKNEEFSMNINGSDADTGYLKAIFDEMKHAYPSELSTYYGISVTTVSNIPQSMGLKSSSAAANAILIGIFNALDLPIDERIIAKIGAKAAIKAKVSITGAYDDALACLMGGIVFTDNKRMVLLKHDYLPALNAVIVIPDYTIPTCSFPRDKFLLTSDKSKEIFLKAMNGDVFTAMYENGKLVADALEASTKIQDDALLHGAVAAGISGTGPACGILVPTEKIKDFQESFPYPIITTYVRNQREL